MTEVPKSCPGVASSTAGKESACSGCPNQGLCSSGKVNTGPDPDVAEIGRKLHSVQHIILVLSGKGGVGKSTIATNLARTLALDESVNVGLLDTDICGPSIPKTTGLEGESVHMSSSGWSPVYVQENLAVMSSGFLLNSLDDAVIWRGPKKNGLIKQFLKDVDWSGGNDTKLDYLIIDTPPGTSDEHLSITSYLKLCDNLRGAVIVTTPQEVSLIDVRKQIDFCNKVGLKVIGLVENMSMFTCNKCGKSSSIFRTSNQSIDESSTDVSKLIGVHKLSMEKSIPIIGNIPIDTSIGKSCDEGTSIFELNEQSPGVKSFIELKKNLLDAISQVSPSGGCIKL